MSTWTLTGTLKDSAGNPLAGQRVTVGPSSTPRASGSGAGSTIVATAGVGVTDSTGAVSLTVTSVANCTWAVLLSTTGNTYLLGDPGANATIYLADLVSAAPTVPPPPPAMTGVQSVTINGSGHLIVTFTDTTTHDAGSAVGPAGPAGATGATGATGPAGPAGSLPTVGFSISFTGGTTTYGAAFTVVDYGTTTPTLNAGGGTWATNGYTIPTTGTYAIVATARRADNTSVGSAHLNVDSNVADSATGFWTDDPTGAARRTFEHQRLVHLASGTVIKQFVYWTTTQQMTQASLSIVLVSQA